MVYIMLYIKKSSSHPQLESGREILGMILNEKLDEILKETMQVICTSQHVSNIIISL